MFRACVECRKGQTPTGFLCVLSLVNDLYRSCKVRLSVSWCVPITCKSSSKVLLSFSGGIRKKMLFNVSISYVSRFILLLKILVNKWLFDSYKLFLLS